MCNSCTSCQGVTRQQPVTLELSACGPVVLLLSVCDAIPGPAEPAVLWLCVHMLPFCSENVQSRSLTAPLEMLVATPTRLLQVLDHGRVALGDVRW